MDAFGVNCTDPSVHKVKNTSNDSPNQKKYKNITNCDVSCIPCCIDAVGVAEPICSKVSTINY